MIKRHHRRIEAKTAHRHNAFVPHLQRVDTLRSIMWRREKSKSHIYICEHKSARVMKYLFMEAAAAEDSIISGFI
jgi:hypothetical protein